MFLVDQQIRASSNFRSVFLKHTQSQIVEYRNLPVVLVYPLVSLKRISF